MRRILLQDNNDVLLMAQHILRIIVMEKMIIKYGTFLVDMSFTTPLTLVSVVCLTWTEN